MTLEEELQMGPITNSYHRALLNVVFTGAWMGDRMNQALKPYGISEQQYNILRILRGQKGNPINLQDISSRMVHKSSNTTRLVEKLRLKGLVDRQVCADNRRKVEIVILPEGLELLEQATIGINNSDQEIMNHISDEEAKALASLLDKLRG